MLDDGVDVECASPDGYTALHAAAKRDCVASLRVLVCELGAHVDATSRDGFRAFPVPRTRTLLFETFSLSPTLRVSCANASRASVVFSCE